MASAPKRRRISRAVSKIESSLVVRGEYRAPTTRTGRASASNDSKILRRAASSRAA
jgi:hypothetical protein